MRTDHEETRRKTLRYSLLDGIFASCMNGFTQDYFTPFLLFLGGTVREVGFLSALPNIVGSLVQVKTYDFIMFFKSRKRVITLFVFMQALILLFMALIALFQWSWPGLFIAAVVLFATTGAISAPAWGSLMAELVPENSRGKYFGWRNSILGVIIVVSSMAAGIMLYYMQGEALALGFALIFGAAFVFRLISWRFLHRMEDPESSKDHIPVPGVSLRGFFRKFRGNNFARFVLCVSMLNFSVNLAGPYFAVLLLRELQYNYVVYSVIMMAAPLTMYIMMRRWGALADSIGNVKVMRITGPLISLIPLFWLVSLHPVFLVGAQIFSGFVWAGYNLSASNFIFDAVEKEKRVRYISYFNVLNGIMLSAGAIIGGLVIQVLPPVMGYKILTMFIISSVLRLVITTTLPLGLKEVRRVEDLSGEQLFFSLIGIRPLLGIQRKTIRYLR